MDYYKILGLGKNANKDEIKVAFRKLALKFHPDRHVKSSKAAQEDAMRRFKEVSEAYDVLSDDKKRAAYYYNYGSTGFGHGYNGNPYGSYRSGGGNGSYNGSYNSYQRRRTTYGSSSFSRFWNFRFGSPLLYFSSMDFVIHAVFAGVLIGSLFIADATGKALWERQNTGKSFEETMNALNHMKGGRTSSTEKTKDSKEI